MLFVRPAYRTNSWLPQRRAMPPAGPTFPRLFVKPFSWEAWMGRKVLWMIQSTSERHPGWSRVSSLSLLMVRYELQSVGRSVLRKIKIPTRTPIGLIIVSDFLIPNYNIQRWYGSSAPTVPSTCSCSGSSLAVTSPLLASSTID